MFKAGLRHVLQVRLRLIRDGEAAVLLLSKIVLVLSFGVSCLIAASDPAVTDGMSNGRAWNGMAPAVRFVYLVGLCDGMRQVHDEIVSPSPSAPVNNGHAQEEVVPLLPTGKGFPDMIVAVDQFYGNTENLDIPIPVAARHERSAIQGRDPKELAESLRRLRILYKVSKELDELDKK